MVWGPAQGTWVPGGAPSLPPFQTRVDMGQVGASRATSRNLRWGQGHRSGAGQQVKGKEFANQKTPRPEAPHSGPTWLPNT